MATFFKPTSQKSKKHAQNSTSELSIDAHDHAGNGLCLSSSPITVIPQALLGEKCIVSYTKQSKKVNFATVVKILTPSPLRAAPFCEFYLQCGGCSLQHANAKDGLELKQKALKDYVSKQLNLPDDFIHGEAWQAPVLSAIDYSQNPVQTQYRRRIRLAIDARNKQKIKIGFRAQGTKSIVDIPRCPVSSSVINDCLPNVRQVLKQLPSIHKVGHVIITEGEKALQVALFTKHDLCKKSYAKLLELAQMLTIEVVVKIKGGNTVCLHDSSEIQQNDEAATKNESAILIEDVAGVKLAVESEHFLQVNKAVNQGLLKKVKSWLNPSKEHTLYDFFCGSGNFSLALAKHVGTVNAYEGVNDMVVVARANANAMRLNNCHFSTLDLSCEPDLQSLHFAQNSIVILDPSREGALELCQLLANTGVEKIVYVSCNPNSFARDASYLMPFYALHKIAALDMFPFTKHIEVIALFTLLK